MVVIKDFYIKYIKKNELRRFYYSNIRISILFNIHYADIKCTFEPVALHLPQIQ
jgi:hypothetical protein